MKNNRSSSWLYYLMATVCGIAVLTSLSFHYFRQKTLPMIHGMILPVPRPVAPFVLQSTLDKPFTDQSLKGKWSLMFFGYTHCPDICPTTLMVLNQAWQSMANQKIVSKIQVIFVSIDPQRDKIENLAQYVHYFNPHFIGLTGSSDQLKSLTSQLGVPYFVENNPNKPDYRVDHGSMIVMIDPNGYYHAVLTAPHELQSLLHDITAITVDDD